MLGSVIVAYREFSDRSAFRDVPRKGPPLRCVQEEQFCRGCVDRNCLDRYRLALRVLARQPHRRRADLERQARKVLLALWQRDRD